MRTIPLLLWVLVAGIASGVIFQRSRLCFVSALRDLFLFRALQMSRAILLLFLVTVGGGALLISLHGGSAIPVMGPTPSAALFGGAIFALGMVLAGSCAAGAFWRLGEGQLSQLVIMAGMLAGTWLHVELQLFAVSQVQPTFSGWTAVAILAALLVGLYGWERQQAHPGEEWSDEVQPRSLLERLREPWSPAVGALAMAGLLVGFMALTGQTWGVTRAFLFDDLSPITFALGLTAGGYLGARWGHEWRVRPIGGRASVVVRLVGGVLMGYGARVGWGCTVGAVMSGMVNLSVQPWYWLIGALLGAAVGAVILRRYMRLYL